VEQAEVAAFEHAHPGVDVSVFRAPTGQLNARVAADVRSGGIRADVIWACDPLTMHGYDEQGLLAPWTPPNASAVPAGYRAADFAAVDVLYMVVVVHDGTPPPASWAGLASPSYRGAVALPDPGFAASALGLLGYLSSAPGYGIDFYRRLHANHAVQVAAPDDVLSGVATGKYRAGATLANAAYAARKKGSPISVRWPRPGGVAIFAPVGVTTRHGRSPLAGSFAAFLISRAGQQLLVAQNTYPALPGVAGPLPLGATVAPDWPALYPTYQKLLEADATVFGG
jgi:iron(III) transport system substrate-binding protein